MNKKTMSNTPKHADFPFGRASTGPGALVGRNGLLAVLIFVSRRSTVKPFSTP